MNNVTIETNLNNEGTGMNNKLAAAKAQIAAKLQAAKEKAEAELWSNEKFQDAMVAQAIREEATDRLSELDAACEAIVAGMEIYSKTLRKARTWTPRKRYGYGNQFADLAGLLTGIQYSVAEHNEQMLTVTGLSKDLIERTLVALGDLPYYNINHNVIVEGTPTNVDELLQCVQLIEVILGITIDKSLITQANADRQYNAATIRAEGALAEAESTALMDFAIVRD